jgi:hypothetical protein
MSDEKNILCQIQKAFINFVGKFYSDPKIASRDIENLTLNVKQYLVLLREAIFDYYNIGSFVDEELYGLITNE